MKKLLLFISAICTSLATFGQNYYPIKRNDVYYYTNNAFVDAFPLKIDSVKLEGKDSVYFMYKQIRKVESGACNYTSLGDSWLGDSIRVKEDGSCVFLNKFNKPFELKTQAKLGDKWIAYESAKWKAEIAVSKVGQETFFYKTDSSKTYTINILKTDGSDTTHPYDGFELVLSKTRGFVKIINFYNWENNEGGFLEFGLKSLFMFGEKGSSDGFNNLTGKDFFDFEVGDIFHREQSQSYFGDFTRISELDTIFSKKTTDSSVTYKIVRATKTNQNNVLSFKKDTLTETYLYNFLSRLPKTASKMSDLSIFTYSNDFNKWGKETGFDLQIGTKENCINELVDGGMCHHVYYNGLGGPYYTCKAMIGIGSYSRSLVYYKKTKDEWGTPIVLGTSEEMLQSQITVSPNPASGFVNFDLGKVSNAVKIDLMDNSGKIVYSETALRFAKIDVSSFKKGMYFYSISSDNNKRLTGKLIVE